MHLVSAALIFGSLIGVPDAPTVALDFSSIRKDGREFATFVETAARMIAVGHVKESTPRQLVGWAIEGLYENRKRDVPPAVRKRLDDLPKAAAADVLRLLSDVYQETRVSRTGGIEETLSVAVDAMSRRLEPGARPEDVRGRYIAAKDVKPFGMIQRPVGVGLIFEADKKSGMLRVITPVRDGPAHKAGIGAGDIITHFRIYNDAAGKALAQPRLVSTKGMTRERAVEIVLGPFGTKIGLVIKRPKDAAP
jgi:C-terminal processing protease CtpA/Prc